MVKSLDQIRAVLELELCSTEQNNIDASKVYEAMGGYAPTYWYHWSRNGFDSCNGKFI